jgi:ABC-type uncharacterized transport system YnjBCD permease subunit
VLKALLKLVLVLLASFVAGLAFGILPCYLFPVLGGHTQTWCGFKGPPRYFLEQFSIGAVLTGLLLGYLLFFRRRR